MIQWHNLGSSVNCSQMYFVFWAILKLAEGYSKHKVTKSITSQEVLCKTHMRLLYHFSSRNFCRFIVVCCCFCCFLFCFSWVWGAGLGTWLQSLRCLVSSPALVLCPLLCICLWRLWTGNGSLASVLVSQLISCSDFIASWEPDWVLLPMDPESSRHNSRVQGSRIFQVQLKSLV